MTREDLISLLAGYGYTKTSENYTVSPSTMTRAEPLFVIGNEYVSIDGSRYGREKISDLSEEQVRKAIEYGDFNV